jgi:hypothetical protein
MATNDNQGKPRLSRGQCFKNNRAEGSFGQRPRASYRLLPVPLRASPSGRTVTIRPGWRNIIFAIEGEMGLPKRQHPLPFGISPLAQAANSSGVGGWPISAAQRRTMKPSIILCALFLQAEESSMTHCIKEIPKRFNKLAGGFYFIAFTATLTHHARAGLGKIFEFSVYRMRQLLPRYRRLHY